MQLQSRHQWLLLFLGAEGGMFAPDQVRVMKGLFLVSRSPGHPTAELYDFKAYDYGPFDSRVYRDLDALRIDGLVRVQQDGTTRKEYYLTDEGRAAFEDLHTTTPQDQYAAVVDAKRRVTSVGFDALLQDIYQRYPEYADRSVARVALQAS